MCAHRLNPPNKIHYCRSFLFQHYECELVFDTQRTQYFLGAEKYEKVQANNDNNDEKNSQRAESISHIH